MKKAKLIIEGNEIESISQSVKNDYEFSNIGIVGELLNIYDSNAILRDRQGFIDAANKLIDNHIDSRIETYLNKKKL